MLLLAMGFAALSLKFAALCLAPIIIPVAALAVGTISGAKEERDAREKTFLVIYGIGLLLVALITIGGFRAIL